MYPQYLKVMLGLKPSDKKAIAKKFFEFPSHDRYSLLEVMLDQERTQYEEILANGIQKGDIISPEIFEVRKKAEQFNRQRTSTLLLKYLLNRKNIETKGTKEYEGYGRGYFRSSSRRS